MSRYEALTRFDHLLEQLNVGQDNVCGGASIFFLSGSLLDRFPAVRAEVIGNVLQEEVSPEAGSD